jgi:hypothetical protein
VLPLPEAEVDDAELLPSESVPLPPELSRRFIVGRSGSSDAVVLPLPEVDPADPAEPEELVEPAEPVVDAVLPELSVEPESLPSRRFIVGRSGSSDAVVLPLPEADPVEPPDPAEPVELVEPPDPAVGAVLPEPESLVPRRLIEGRSGSLAEALVEFTELVNTGSVFEGFSFATDLFATASGFTLPYPNQPSSYARSPVALSACRCRAYARSSIPLSTPPSCSSYSFPVSRANGTGRATYTPASSSLPSIKIDTGISRLAVGFIISPVHSYTPTARTTCSGFATLCICAPADPHPAPHAAQPANATRPHIARSRISLITPTTQ